MWVKKQQLALEMEQLIGSELRKDHDRAVCCLFNLYAEHITRNAGLDKLQAGIKTGRRNINDLRYVVPLMAERDEEIKSFLMRVNEKSERAGLKPNMKKLRSWHLVLSSLHAK